MVLSLVLVSIAMGVIGQVLLKVGAHTPVHTSTDLMRDLLRPTTVVALAMYIAATLMWITVLSRAPLSYAYPLLALGYCLVVAVSAVVLHEPVPIQRWIGVAVIAIGFIVTATS